MISRKLYVQLLLRVLLMAAASLGLGWILYGRASDILALVPAAILLALILNTAYYLNRVNRRIFYFFDAIRNEDSSLSFPDDGQLPFEKDLSRSMLRVNRQIKGVYKENQQQEQYFQALIEHAATGMFTFNRKGFILHSNQQARHLLGLDPFTHISQLENVGLRIQQAIAEIRPGQQHLAALDRNEELVQLLIRASSFLSEGEELMLLSIHDIRNELEEKEIDSWRRLIQVMRHEIMNSVTPITSLSAGLSTYFHTEGKVKTSGQIDEKTIETTLKGLELIHEQAQGLKRFVESYRELTRMPEPEKRRFPVRSLLDHVALLARSFPNAGKTELHVENGPGDIEILADEKQISQVMVNLVKNAFQATEHTANARVEIVSGHDGRGRPMITVSDNGPGIPGDLQDKIFIPFFTTRENGSGIGLSLSRQIMQMHGGSLKLNALPGRQTSFILLF